MKKYTKPLAEKLTFDYTENVTAASTSPGPRPHHGDVGHGLGMGGGCDHTPGHGTPKTDHPVAGC